MPLITNAFPRPPLVWIKTLDKDGSTYLDGRPTAAFLEYMSKQERQLSVITSAGNPVTLAIVPAFIGQYCADTVGNDLYWASTTVSAGWKKLTP